MNEKRNISGIRAIDYFSRGHEIEFDLKKINGTYRGWISIQDGNDQEKKIEASGEFGPLDYFEEFGIIFLDEANKREVLHRAIQFVRKNTNDEVRLSSEISLRIPTELVVLKLQENQESGNQNFISFKIPK